MIDNKSKNNFAATESIKVPRAHADLLKDGGISLKRMPKLECTPAGYQCEKHEI